jgi:hypothetical protein
MQRPFEEIRDDFMHAIQTANWNDLAIHSTELLKIDDTIPWVWSNRGLALQKLGHAFDAILNYDRAFALDHSAIICTNKGAAYLDMEKFDKAIEWLNKAIELDPNIPQTYMNMGHTLKAVGDVKGSIAAYRMSVEKDPDYADGHMALGMMLLKDEQLKEGWGHYEHRWKSQQLKPRGLTCPQWKGQNLEGKSILVYGEQGFGDMIQFAPYAQFLAEKYPDASVIVEGRQPLKRLLATMPSVKSVINIGEKLPHLDYNISMMTLGGMFTPTVDSIRPYEYFIDQDSIDRWVENTQPLPPGFRIGVCWAGLSRVHNPDAARVDSIRSTTLQQFAQLTKIPGLVWLSLQKGSPSEQLKNCPAGMTIGDFSEDMFDFYETCAAAKTCDLVISVDTAVAHATASVGVPTWVLSRYDGCWRWFHGREDSPWYPTVRVFEQPKKHDWDGVMAQVYLALKTRLDSSRSL